MKNHLVDNSNQNKGYCDIICEGLIGHFSFNNDFEDSTNNFQKTEVFGDKIRFTEKNKNTGISFNGENGLILRSNKFDTNKGELILDNGMDIIKHSLGFGLQYRY